MNCDLYKEECSQIEVNSTNETCFQTILRESIESTDYRKKNMEFKAHLDVLQRDF